MLKWALAEPIWLLAIYLFRVICMKIGSYELPSSIMLAPMAGVTDVSFRKLCRKLGAGLAVSEMVSSNPALRKSRQTIWRCDHRGEPEPISVQILGNDPLIMADAAMLNVDHGAQIIDINMGCPAKKVCHKAAGSALMKDERLVWHILEAVVRAVKVPVTLKIRTGWALSHKNGVEIAKIAENSGISMLAVHGRTRDDGYHGPVDYGMIREIKSVVNIPVVANGDIVDGPSAARMFQLTGADGIMIGRAAIGHPWIFREIDYFLQTKRVGGCPSMDEIESDFVTLIHELYAFYGEAVALRRMRKYLNAFIHNHRTYDPEGLWRRQLLSAETMKEQLTGIKAFVRELAMMEVEV